MKMIYPGRVCNSSGNILKGTVKIFNIDDIQDIFLAVIVDVSVTTPKLYQWGDRTITQTYEYHMSKSNGYTSQVGKICGDIPPYGENIFNFKIENFACQIIRDMLGELYYTGEIMQKEVRFVYDKEKQLLYAERNV